MCLTELRQNQYKGAKFFLLLSDISYPNSLGIINRLGAQLTKVIE